ncbi:FAD-linked sulfhydryl oxidase ERV2 [Spathaspora sp. JA1]|nr:FAD-linked sulfhydryl oxidase ERV2 [Spathaspora sp. JA1]
MTSVNSSNSLSLGTSIPLSLNKNFNIQEQALKSQQPPEVQEQSSEEDPDDGQQVLEESNPNEITEIPFMPKMANATLRAELGRASWKLFHTILARYPDTPSESERKTLENYINLFAQVYPCGDCARHFMKLLQKYPPQTKSRKTAALWGCDVHNKVNKVLKKQEYDCTNILEDYDCGCGDDEQEQDFTLGNQSMNDLRKVEVEKEESQLG